MQSSLKTNEIMLYSVCKVAGLTTLTMRTAHTQSDYVYVFTAHVEFSPEYDDAPIRITNKTIDEAYWSIYYINGSEWVYPDRDTQTYSWSYIISKDAGLEGTNMLWRVKNLLFDDLSNIISFTIPETQASYLWLLALFGGGALALYGYTKKKK